MSYRNLTLAGIISDYVEAIPAVDRELPVKLPRVRDKTGELKFISSIIPPYMKRSASIEKLLPLLYLKGISTGDFQEVLAPIFGDEAKNLSPGVISRLKTDWENEYNAWSKRDLSRKHYVYLFADGIYLNARMEDASSCGASNNMGN